MRSLAALVFLSCSLAFSQARAARCWAACERQVTEPRQRAGACNACLTAPDDAAAFLSRLNSLPPAILEDPDWQVRWGALRARGRATHVPAEQVLCEWINRARTEELERACLTAVHAAGTQGRRLAVVLAAAGPRARCEAIGPALQTSLVQDLYAELPATRREALTHLAAAFGQTPARVVLGALPGHPHEFDALVLETLEAVLWSAPSSPVASLLEAATPADAAAMNRALAVYAARRDAARAALVAPEESTRREALATLSQLAPLSEEELLAALADPRPSLRLAAARGLARGEGRTLAAMVSRRLSAESTATLPQQRTLLTLLGEVKPAECAPIALAAWRSAAGAGSLRALALAVAGGCDWAAAHPEVRAALRSPERWQRAAAVEALGAAPRTEQLGEELLRAIEAPEAEVRIAACHAISALRWRGGVGRVIALGADPDSAVRAAALAAQAALDAPGLGARLVSSLETDAAAQVRAAAAALLAGVGDGRAVSALRRAAGNDRDAHVKLVASQSLRTLGVGSPAP